MNGLTIFFTLLLASTGAAAFSPWNLLTTSGPSGRRNANLWCAPITNDGSSSYATLYLFGGKGSSSRLADFWQYQTKTNTWSQLSVNSAIPARSGAASWRRSQNGHLFFFGGRTDDGTALNDFWMYDGIQWQAVNAGGSAPSGRYGTLYWTYQDEFYFYGGLISSSSATNTMFKYSPTTNTWSQISYTGTGPGNIDDGSAAVYKTTVTMFGGSATDNQVYEFDHATNTFSVIPTTASTSGRPGTRQDMVSWKTPDNTFHIFGGQSGDALIVGQGRWQLDPVSLQWFSNIGEVHPSSRWGAVSCVTPTAAFIFGGAESSFYHGDLWRFDFSPSNCAAFGGGTTVPITITQSVPSPIIQTGPQTGPTGPTTAPGSTFPSDAAAMAAAILSGIAILIVGVGFFVLYRKIKEVPASV